MKYHCLEDFSVRFAETDTAGIVHFTNFLRWAENAESDFFRKHGSSLIEKTDAETQVGWPKVGVSANYKSPARYADCIRVKIRPAALPPPKARSIFWEFAVFRVETDGAETLLADGAWKSVFAEIDGNGNVRVGNAIPAPVLAAIQSLAD